MDERKAQVRAAVEAYFRGLAAKNLSIVPYDANAALRAPLAPGGSAVPIKGKVAILEYFSPMLPNLGAVRVLDIYFNEDLSGACGAAEIELVTPRVVLRVADRFRFNAEGKIIEQENHFDPRPAFQ